MEILFKVILLIHIVCGTTGLLTGSLNIIRKKGDKKHKIIGNVFAWSMLCGGFSALILSILHPNYFLFIIGIFTIYMVGTGKRYVYLKLLGSSQKPDFIDWLLTGVMLITGLTLVVLGINMLLSQKTFGLVLIVFGFFSLLFVRVDFKNYRGKSQIKNYWLITHLQRMIGAYIAAFTAFLVVNAHLLPIVLPSVFAWLLPTFVLTPVIINWSRKYAVKKS